MHAILQLVIFLAIVIGVVRQLRGAKRIIGDARAQQAEEPVAALFEPERTLRTQIFAPLPIAPAVTVQTISPRYVTTPATVPTITAPRRPRSIYLLGGTPGNADRVDRMMRMMSGPGLCTPRIDAAPAGRR